MAIWVKICGVTDIATAMAAYEAGANAVGLVFAEQPCRVSVPQARAIVKELPRGCEKIGVFQHQSMDEIKIVLAEVPLDAARAYFEDGMIPAVDLPVELVPAFSASVLSRFSTRGMGKQRYVRRSPESAGSGKA